MKESFGQSFNKARKIARVAGTVARVAHMDPSHAAMNPEEFITNIKRPDVESGELLEDEVQTAAPLTEEQQLAENLKKMTKEYFKNEKETLH